MAMLFDSFDDVLSTKSFVKPARSQRNPIEEMEEEEGLANITLPVCPRPSAIPNLKLNKGTTTLAFKFQGGVIVAVDSRASSGEYVASATTQKVIPVNDFILGTMAGGAADCQYWLRVLCQECRLWELRNRQRPSVAVASKILSDITYHYKKYGLSIGAMVTGWDKFGPSLYMVDDQGTRLKGDLFSVGSGSIYAYGILDAEYKHDLSLEDAITLGRKAIMLATHRDAASGGFVNVYHVHAPDANGKCWTKISRDDCVDLMDQAQEKKIMARVSSTDP
eukprot:TRINITY_DN16480_c0_g1_i1.p1 TRINITY_DN16480_c0_g1~~TRINITY_DN16480_c0_g1_i1.p1  ORF type:complete len:278 (+),score=77.97 TRINITY_DN16480_c0_g1_i1:52-885(+)